MYKFTKKSEPISVFFKQEQREEAKPTEERLDLTNYETVRRLVMNSTKKPVTKKK